MHKSHKTIAFLRAINVGGRRIKMDELRDCFLDMGLENVETFLASGNVAFDAGEHTPAALEQTIQSELHARLGYTVTTFVRTNREIAEIAQYTPFAPELMAQAQALNVAFIAAPLSAEQETQLQTLPSAVDEFHAHGREIYWLCRVKQSESDFSNAVLERTLKLEATFRTINTVVRLAKKYPVAAV